VEAATKSFTFTIHRFQEYQQILSGMLSKSENLPDSDFINSSLPAVFLLTGFISDYEKPMEASSRLVEEICPGLVSISLILNRPKS